MPRHPVGSDPWGIPNPDPTRHYRWIRDDRETLADATRSYGDRPGYTLEPASNAEKLGFKAEYVADPAGRIRYGFNVLGSIPIEEWNRRVREDLDEQRGRVTAAEDGFLAAMDGVPGAKAFRREPGEIADRKEFATRETQNRVYVGQSSAATRGVRPSKGT